MTEFIFEGVKIDEGTIFDQHAEAFDSAFKKLDIYSRNVRLGLVNEHAKYNDRDIYLNEDEKEAIKAFAFMMYANLLETYAKENNIELQLNEGFFGDVKDFAIKTAAKAKDAYDGAVKSGKEIVNDLGDKVSSVVDKLKLPESMTAILNFVSSVVKNGIDSTSKLVKFIEEAIEKIGNGAIRGLFVSLGIFSNNTSENKVYSYQEYLQEAEENSDGEKFTNKSLDEYDDNIQNAILGSFNDESEKETFKEILEDTLKKAKDKKDNGTNESVVVEKYTIDDLVNAINEINSLNEEEAIMQGSKAEKSKINFKNIIEYFKDNNKFFTKIKELRNGKKITLKDAIVGGAKKLFQYLKQLTISFVISFLTTRAIPIIMRFCANIGIAIFPTGWIAVALEILWYVYGYLRILENRYKQVANNPAEEENFFNIQTTLGLVGKTVSIICQKLSIDIPSIRGYVSNYFTGLLTNCDWFQHLTESMTKVGADCIYAFCKGAAKIKDSNFDSSFVNQQFYDACVDTGNADIAELALGKNVSKYSHISIETIETKVDANDTLDNLSPEKKKELSELLYKTGNEAGGKNREMYIEKLKQFATDNAVNITLFNVGSDKITGSKDIQAWCEKKGIKLSDEIDFGKGSTVTPMYADGTALKPKDLEEFSKTVNDVGKKEGWKKGSNEKDNDVFAYSFSPGSRKETIAKNPDIKGGRMIFNLLHKKYNYDDKILVGKDMTNNSSEYISGLRNIVEVDVKTLDKYGEGIEAWSQLKNNISEALKGTKKEGKLEKRKLMAIYALIKDEDEDKPVDQDEIKDVEKWEMPKAGAETTTKALKAGDGANAKALDAHKEEAAMTKFRADVELYEKEKEKVSESVKIKPLIVFSYDTLEGCDMIKNKSWRRPKPYSLKGAFDKIAIRPCGNMNDANDVRDGIYEILLGILEEGVKTVYDLHKDEIKIGKDKNNDKYVPLDGVDKNEKMEKFGDFTISDFCNILNADKNDARNIYEDIYGANTDETKTKEQKKQEAYDYVTKYIVPVLASEDTDVHKAIYNNAKLRNWLFDGKKFKTNEIVEDIEVMDAIIMPMAAYNKNSKLTRKQAIGLFKTEETEEDKELKKRNDRIKTLVSIIYEYKYDTAKWNEDAQKALPAGDDKKEQEALKAAETKAKAAIEDKKKTEELGIPDDKANDARKALSAGSSDESVTKEDLEKRARKWMKTKFIPCTNKENKNHEFADDFADSEDCKYFFKDGEVDKDKLMDDKAVYNTLYKICCNNLKEFLKKLGDKEGKDKYFNVTLIKTLTKKYGKSEEEAKEMSKAIRATYDLVIKYRCWNGDKKDNRWRKMTESEEFEFNEYGRSFLQERRFGLLDFESFMELQ